ncbi:MAG TPA: ATP-grasp domain-containing protein [Anaeromyxobacteraceae bacterium]|nr:ATP-grasp domain-containing protein [Anaeromyxobacteraceae bacterium]
MEPSLLLLVPLRSYRTEDFLAAASRLGVPVVVGSDLCHAVEERFGAKAGELALDYRRPTRAASRVVEFAAERPIGGIVATDEGTAIIAALSASRLGLSHNPPEATRRAGNKHLQRQALLAAGLPVPPFSLHPLAHGPERAAREVPYPCVLKPLVLSASRGVIRADDPAGFVAAWRRIEAILQGARVERRPKDEESGRAILVEGFVVGSEVALEGLLRAGELEVLALFDKPDPLDGPYFEETLYVTPSRHPGRVQREVASLVARAARALGLVEGPLHAELRLSEEGPVVLEVAARSIGGLCSRTLRFGAGISLEELVVAHAMGLPTSRFAREDRAAGVMMLPIPHGGILRGVAGLERARAVEGIEEIVITVPEGREVLPLPEGDAYLGFAFARGERPESVEASLRQAHALLEIDIRPALPTV